MNKARDILTNQIIQQFIKYFFVGGIAALVEWATFFIANTVIEIYYLIAVIISFILATAVNFVFAKKFVFKNKPRLNKNKELVMVYFISLLGLIFNLTIMWIFVDRFRILPILSKIISTGLVFLWNFSARIFLIYK